MTYGSTVGKKFYEDGTVRRYPGNTVVADILPGNPAYDVMCKLRQMVIESGMDEYLTLLPEDSYHMTVIQGVNDQVRKETHWPKELPLDAPMTQADEFVSTAFLKVGLPGPARMRFDTVNIGTGACIIRLHSVDEAQERILREFRDRAADQLGLHLPNHDNYRFHISLGYVRVIPEGEAAEKLEQLKAQINDYIADQPEFTTAAPYMAYYSDMYAFSPVRIARD